MEVDLQLYPLGAFGTGPIYNLNGITGLILNLQPREAHTRASTLPSRYWSAWPKDHLTSWNALPLALSPRCYTPKYLLL